jgi:hypothetical protein
MVMYWQEQNDTWLWVSSFTEWLSHFDALANPNAVRATAPTAKTPPSAAAPPNTPRPRRPSGKDNMQDDMWQCNLIHAYGMKVKVAEQS